MNQIEHPQTIMLIHDEMVHREMRRNSPPGHREHRGAESPRGPFTGFREMTSRMFFAAGAWISPVRPRMETPAPTGVQMSASAGRNR